MTTSQTTQALVDMLVHRDQMGQKKYGTTLDRADLLPEDWAQHAIEEALDMAGYLARFGATLAELRAENERLQQENGCLAAQVRRMEKQLQGIARVAVGDVVLEADAPDTAGEVGL